MTHIDVAPPPAERDLDDLDALTAGLALVAAEARAQGERDAATVTEVRRLLAEFIFDPTACAGDTLVAIGRAVSAPAVEVTR